MASADIDVEVAKSPSPAKACGSDSEDRLLVRLPNSHGSQVGFGDIAKHFILMGWTAFGGCQLRELQAHQDLTLHGGGLLLTE